MKETNREISNLRLLCSKEKFKTFEEAFSYSQVILDNITKAPRTQIFDSAIYFFITEGELIPARPFIGNSRFGEEFEVIDMSRSLVKSHELAVSALSNLNFLDYQDKERPYLLFTNTESGPEVRIEWFLTN
ncbi:hypothetical protein [Bacteriovorax sp. Seq25_V]|uniref:hypothetical protein n=1 Tax=Bacteriovorax sp. Seq25_V TaxID=1201288 RepID=UPI00038A3770|nr:hypothetical protein [Bacteriovorax sp. Seq25_V]EQC46245.1 hypothetical protein M900_1613 [Bacteriovorax sp. Seq25_V]